MSGSTPIFTSSDPYFLSLEKILKDDAPEHFKLICRTYTAINILDHIPEILTSAGFFHLFNIGAIAYDLGLNKASKSFSFSLDKFRTMPTQSGDQITLAKKRFTLTDFDSFLTGTSFAEERCCEGIIAPKLADIKKGQLLFVEHNTAHVCAMFIYWYGRGLLAPHMVELRLFFEKHAAEAIKPILQLIPLTNYLGEKTGRMKLNMSGNNKRAFYASLILSAFDGLPRAIVQEVEATCTAYYAEHDSPLLGRPFNRHDQQPARICFPSPDTLRFLYQNVPAILSNIMLSAGFEDSIHLDIVRHLKQMKLGLDPSASMPLLIPDDTTPSDDLRALSSTELLELREAQNTALREENRALIEANTALTDIDAGLLEENRALRSARTAAPQPFRAQLSAVSGVSIVEIKPELDRA